MNKDISVVDLFDEEVSKKEKKLQKKMEKARIKEEKKEKKKAKKLEQQEDIEFNDYLEKIKEEQLVEIPVKIKSDEIKSIEHLEISKPIEELVNKEENKPIKINKDDDKTLNELLDLKKESKPKKYTFLNVLITIFSIILIVISADYLVYNCISNYTDLPTMINCILLSCTVLFYLLSILIKNEGAKKSFQVLSILTIIFFMSYHLFIA